MGAREEGFKERAFSETGVMAKPSMVNQSSQNSGKALGQDSLPLLPQNRLDKATQLCSVLGQKAGSSQTPLPAKKADLAFQAFEGNPWQGLLSDVEVCKLIGTDKLIGLGISDRPEATLDNHKVTCKQVLSQGIVYQVVVIQEQYLVEKEKVVERIVEKEVVKEVEVPGKEKIVEIVKEREVPRKGKKTEKANNKGKVLEVIDLDIVQEAAVAEPQDSKDILVIKEEKVIAVDKIELVDSPASFQDKPWVNLRKRIVEKQKRKTPEPVQDNRTPYQRRTEEPQSPGPIPLEINDHIHMAFKDIDEFLVNKPVATQGFLPLPVGKRVMDQYRTYIEPGFSLDPELAIQLEGLLSGIAFSGVAKRSVAFSTGELEKLSATAFNIVEIFSFMMAAIAIIDGGLEGVQGVIKGKALTNLLEFKPFLGSLDKACRYGVRETLSILASTMMKQRVALASCLSLALPKSFKFKLVKAPLASFEVVPKEILREIIDSYESFVKNRVFAQAIANVGASKFKGSNRVTKKKTVTYTRNMRTRGHSFRSTSGPRGFRGQLRGPSRGVRRATLSNRNLRAFARRDRAVGRNQNEQAPLELTSGAPGHSGESRQ